MARFRIERTFQIEIRRVFVLAGEVLDGTVRPGQRLVTSRIDAPVASVESVLVSASTGLSWVGLTFRYESDEQLRRWTELKLEGSTIQLEPDLEPDDVCPFQSGDIVVYCPSDRGRGLVANGPYANLQPGSQYRVSTVIKGAYVVLEGFEFAPGGGLYWTEFSRSAGS